MKQRRKVSPFIIRRVVGHSMVPILPPKTLVFGWRYFFRVRPGQVVVVEHDGMEKIKRVEKIEADRVYILGDHPETSTDSRHFGWLSQDLVKAVVVWPRTSPREG